MKKLVYMIPIIFILFSCTLKELTFKSYDIRQKTNIKIEYLKSYLSTNNEIIKNIGDNIVHIIKKVTLSTPAYRSNIDFELPKGSKMDIIGPLKVRAKDYYFYCGTTDSGIVIGNSTISYTGGDVIEIYNDGYIRNGACLVKDKKLYAYWRGNYKNIAHFEPETYIEEKYSDNSYEIIYTGKRANEIIITVIEKFKGATKFKQDYTFDISSDNIISYKGLKIEVLQANNSNIKYKVINDDDLSWVE